MKASDVAQNNLVCPRCRATGKPVKPVTLRSLLREELRDAVAESDERGWRFCATPDCPLVYFESGGATFSKDQLTVRVGIKETDAPRPVCYCFGHSVEEIEDDIALTGETGVLDDIKTRMKKACWCETTSPMGSCCLATVTGFVKAAKGRHQRDETTPSEAENLVFDCCAEDPPDTGEDRNPVEDCCAAHESTGQKSASDKARSPRRRLGIFATGGAVLSAALSSACCWLPLLLLAFGASAAGVAGFFEVWRPWFLGGAGLLLGVGFYLAYFRKKNCAPGSACAVPNPRLRRFHRAMLWVAAVFVAAFALFPNYLGTLLDTDSASGAGAPMTDIPENAAVLSIAGMTCEACAVSLQKNLAAVSGVASAQVDYETERAIVVPVEGGSVAPSALAETVQASGYRVNN